MMFLSVSILIALICTTLCSSKKIRVTCIGDSITQGGGCVAQSYVEVLQNILGGDYEVINAGLSSQTMLKKGICNDYSPCSYWNSDTWQSALDSQPDIVTIMLGTNDAKIMNWEGIQQNLGDYYALDYVDMIRNVRILSTRPKVYVIIPPPLFEPYPFDMNSTIINEIFPVLIRDVNTVMDTQLVDIYSALASQPDSSALTCDGCHPTDLANQIIAETIASAITIK